MKKALVLGAGGFIGSHLVRRLKSDGYWVRGVDRKLPEFSDTEADDFFIGDLRSPKIMLGIMSGGFDEVYQLAAEMGGMGYIESAECDIMHNSALININAIQAAVKTGVKRYFFSSSVCVYRDMKHDEDEITESEVYPAMPDNEYGWEKLYAERMILAYGRKHDIEVRIARFQNCYGPEHIYRGIRVKAPAALSCKVAEAKDGGEVEVWGDGKARRSFTYIDDILDGVRALMQSELEGPVNIGSSENETVDELVVAIIKASGKKITIKHIEGPVGVDARNFSKARIYSLGWQHRFSLEEGIALTYPWIEDQIKKEKE